MEEELAVVFEYHCRMLGADRLAYPCVVAGGLNANTLHYITNDHLLRYAVECAIPMRCSSEITADLVILCMFKKCKNCLNNLNTLVPTVMMEWEC